MVNIPYFVNSCFGLMLYAAARIEGEYSGKNAWHTDGLSNTKRVNKGIEKGCRLASLIALIFSAWIALAVGNYHAVTALLFGLV